MKRFSPVSLLKPNTSSSVLNIVNIAIIGAMLTLSLQSSFAQSDDAFYTPSNYVMANSQNSPLQLFFKSGLSGYALARDQLVTIGSNFSVIEGAYPITASYPRTVNDLGPVTQINAPDEGKLLYLIPITAIEEDQIVAGITESQVDSDESAFVHSADPALLTFSRGAQDSLRITWHRDERQLGSVKYRIYRKLYNSSTYNRIAEINDSGLNFYQINDGWSNSVSTCYQIRSYSTTTGKEHYFSHPRCTLTPSPFESEIVSTHIYRLDENTYSIEFWANYRRDDYLVTAKIRRDACDSKLNCFYSYSKPAQFAAAYKDMFGYRTVITRAELVSAGFKALQNPLQIVTRYGKVLLDPVFEIGQKEVGAIFPARGELITMNVNNRIRDRFWLGLYINPISSTWQQAMLNFAVRAKALGYSGLFLDEVRPFRLNMHSPYGSNVEAPSVEYGNTSKFDKSNPAKSDPWGNALITMLTKLKENLRNQGVAMSLVGNTLKVIHPDETNSFGSPAILQPRVDAISKAMDGVMFENAFDNGTRMVTASKWDAEVLKIEELLAADRQVIAFSTPEYSSGFLEAPERRLFLAATPYMVSVNPTKFLFGVHDIMSPNFSYNLFPEHRIPLGMPVIAREWKGNYFYRLFDNGVLLINPSTSTTVINAKNLAYLNKTTFDGLWRVKIRGASTANRNPGQLACEAFSGSSVTLAPGKAIFLLKSNCTP